MASCLPEKSSPEGAVVSSLQPASAAEVLGAGAGCPVRGAGFQVSEAGSRVSVLGWGTGEAALDPRRLFPRGRAGQACPRILGPPCPSRLHSRQTLCPGL